MTALPFMLFILLYILTFLFLLLLFIILTRARLGNFLFLLVAHFINKVVAIFLYLGTVKARVKDDLYYILIENL